MVYDTVCCDQFNILSFVLVRRVDDCDVFRCHVRWANVVNCVQWDLKCVLAILAIGVHEEFKYVVLSCAVFQFSFGDPIGDTIAWCTVLCDDRDYLIV